MTATAIRCPERDLLISCTAIGVTDGAAERTRELLERHAEQFDWGLFLDEAVRHRVTPLVWANFDSAGLASGPGHPIPRIHEQFLRMVYSGNRLRNVALIEALSQILHAAERAGLELLVRKGVYLSTQVYNDLGARLMADVDLLVRRADARRGIELLNRLGYMPGRLSRDMSHVDQYSRDEVAMIGLTIPNLPTMVRMDLNPVVRAIEVDLTTGLFERGTGFDFPIDGVFARATTISLHDMPARVSSVEDFTIDLCAHLYRHAKSITCIRRGTDLNLCRFCDVGRYAGLVTALGRWPAVTELVRAYGLAEPMYFALYWTDHVYPGCVPEPVLREFMPADDEFLYRYGEHEKRLGQWPTRDLFARMFDHSRQRDVIDPS